MVCMSSLVEHHYGSRWVWFGLDDDVCDHPKNIHRHKEWRPLSDSTIRNACRAAQAFALAVAVLLSAALVTDRPVLAAELEQTPSSLDSAKRLIRTLEQKLEESKRDRTALKTQLELSTDEFIERFAERLGSASWKTDPEVLVLRNKLAAAGKEIKNLSLAANDSKAELAAAKDKLQTATSKLDALAKAKDAAVSKLSSLQSEAAAARKEAKSETAKLAESELARKAAGDKLAKAEAAQAALDKELGSVRKTVKEAMARLEALQKAESKIDALEAKLDIAQASASEADDLRADLKKAKLNTENLNVKLGEFRKERDALTAQLDKARKDVAKRIQKVFAVAAEKANTTATDLRTKLKARDAEISKLKKQVTSVSENVERLKSSLSTAETNQKKAETQLADMRKKQQEQHETLQAAVEKAKTAVSDLTLLREKFEASKQQAKLVASQKVDLRMEKAQLYRKYVTVQQQLEGMSKQAQESTAKRAKLDQLLKAALQTADTAEKSWAATEEESSNTVSALREELAAKTQQLGGLKSKLAEAQAVIKRARENIAKRIDKMIAAAMATPDVEVIDLRKELATAKKKIARLTAQQGEMPSAADSNKSTQ